MTNFGDLYTYNTSKGTVIPSVEEVEDDVKSTLLEIFGSEFSLEPETIGGRLAEAMTLYFRTVCAVNAQNAGMVNPREAVGAYLDHIGAYFGVNRQQDESDGAFRKRISESASIGPGFASSIRRELGNLPGVSDVVVLDNGFEDPRVLPLDEYGRPMAHSVTVDPHSVFISLLVGTGGATHEDIARAIMKTKSAGCGFTENPEYGTSTSMSVTEGGETLFEAKVYVPRRLYAGIAVTVRDDNYTGDSIVTDTQDGIVELLSSRRSCSTTSGSDVIAAVAALGSGIVVDSVSFSTGDSANDLRQADSLVVKPYRYIDVSASDITVNVV